MTYKKFVTLHSFQSFIFVKSLWWPNICTKERYTLGIMVGVSATTLLGRVSSTFRWRWFKITFKHMIKASNSITRLRQFMQMTAITTDTTTSIFNLIRTRFIGYITNNTIIPSILYFISHFISFL